MLESEFLASQGKKIRHRRAMSLCFVVGEIRDKGTHYEVDGAWMGTGDRAAVLNNESINIKKDCLKNWFFL
jgi:hypothetical protein